MASSSPIPSDAPFTGAIVKDPKTGQLRPPYMSDDFNNWLIEFQEALNAAPASIGETVSLADQGASIGTTPALVAPDTGLYRVSVYARIVRAGSVSSSLTVTVGSTDETVSVTQAFGPATGNTTATILVGSAVLRCDQAQALTYATTYADGGGATSMQYDLCVTVEQVPA